jgi:hypothetical protein
MFHGPWPKHSSVNYFWVSSLNGDSVLGPFHEREMIFISWKWFSLVILLAHKLENWVSLSRRVFKSPRQQARLSVKTWFIFSYLSRDNWHIPDGYHKKPTIFSTFVSVFTDRKTSGCLKPTIFSKFIRLGFYK